jgi:hypothetical protein
MRTSEGLRSRETVLLFASIVLISCGGDAAPRAISDAGMMDVVELVRAIELPEDDSVIFVRYNVTTSSAGEYLVADAAESQVRHVDSLGHRLAVFGRPGEGPGEFRRLIWATPLPGNRIATLERMGKVTIFSAEGIELAKHQLPVVMANQIHPLPDGAFLVVGIVPGSSSRLHVWDPGSGEVRLSFFAPVDGASDEAAVAALGVATATLRGDTVATVFTLSDSVYLFTVSGQRIAALKIPYPRFARSPQPPATGSGQEELAAWVAGFTLTSDVFWTDDGFLVQYREHENLLPRWRLLRMDRQGRGIFHVPESGRLLAATVGGLLTFADPEWDLPNRWLVGRLK